MFFETNATYADTFGADPKVYEAIAEWAIEQILTDVPQRNLNSTVNFTRGHFDVPVLISFSKLESLITIEQLILFKKLVIEELKNWFAANRDSTFRIRDTDKSYYSSEKNVISLHNIVCNPAKLALLPEVFIPSMDLTYKIYFAFDASNNRMINAWRTRIQNEQAIINLGDQTQKPYTSETFEKFREHIGREPEPNSDYSFS